MNKHRISANESLSIPVDLLLGTVNGNRLKPNEVLIYSILKSMHNTVYKIGATANETQYGMFINYSTEVLMDVTNLSVNTVYNSLKRLESLGLIKRIRRYHSKQQTEIYVQDYHLLLDE